MHDYKWYKANPNLECMFKNDQVEDTLPNMNQNTSKLHHNEIAVNQTYNLESQLSYKSSEKSKESDTNGKFQSIYEYLPTYRLSTKLEYDTIQDHRSANED